MISIRGAITVEQNTEVSILEETKNLILKIEDENNLDRENVVSMIFTCTDDLDKVAPSKAVRELGYLNAGLMNFNEVKVEGSLGMCVRVLILYNTNKDQKDAKHVYLKGAQVLRPDLI